MIFEEQVEAYIYADPLKAPDVPTNFTIHFEKGIPVKLEVGSEVITGSLAIFKGLNKIGHDNGKNDLYK